MQGFGEDCTGAAATLYVRIKASFLDKKAGPKEAGPG